MNPVLAGWRCSERPDTPPPCTPSEKSEAFSTIFSEPQKIDRVCPCKAGTIRPKLDVSTETAGRERNAKTDWRRGWDSNPRLSFPNTRFPSVLLKPLGHLSVIIAIRLAYSESGPSCFCEVSDGISERDSLLLLQQSENHYTRGRADEDFSICDHGRDVFVVGKVVALTGLIAVV